MGDFRSDYEEAAGWVVGLVHAVPDDAWDRPALGVWTLRELAGHTARSFLTVERYLAATPPGPVTIADAVEYFTTDVPGFDDDAVAERGREEGRNLGERPAEAFAAHAERVLALVRATPDDAPVTLAFGVMTLAGYVPARVLELVVHGIDIAGAIGVPADPPPSPLAATAHLVTDIALRRGRGPDLCMVATGRDLGRRFTALSG